MKLRRGLLLLLCCLPIVLLAACEQPANVQGTQPTGGYHKITAVEAKQMMEETDVVILDVRTPEEYKAGHIKGALSLPNETIGAGKPEELADTNATLLVYCRTGVRSRQASEKLVKLGYTNVYDFGGIQDWTYGTVTE